MRHRFVASILATAVLALAAFTGTSLAGNGHGNGGQSGNNGNGHDQTQTTPAPAPAPVAPAPAAAPAKTSHGNSAKTSTSHGNSDKKSSTSPSNPATGGSNSNGVKPSSTTKHDTYAKASSDQTKKYGNGKTAGQIATQAGYGNATLHGPGNSQPHKTMCGGHEVDVHALKAKGSKCGETPAQPETQTPAAPAPSVQPPAQTQSCAGATTTQQVLVGVKHFIGPKGSGRYVVIHPSTHSAHYTGKHPDDVPIYETVTSSVAGASNCAPAATVTPAVTPTASATAAATATQTPATAAVQAARTAQAPATAVSVGAVKGATATLTPQKKPARGGVLGATTRLGSAVTSRHLPFTGLPLWIFVAVAAALILTGAAVRRTSADRSI